MSVIFEKALCKPSLSGRSHSGLYTTFESIVVVVNSHFNLDLAYSASDTGLGLNAETQCIIEIPSLESTVID